MNESLLKTLQEKHESGSLRPNELDNSGVSLIHQAAGDGQLTCLKWLLKYGGDINVRSSEGFVPAHYASAGGYLQILQFIHDKDKENISKESDDGITPLFVAAQEGQLDCLIWLTKTSATPPDTQTKDGRTAAHAASQEGKLECLRYLLKACNAKSNIKDYYGSSLAHYASANDHWKIVKWLIEHCGLNGNEQDNVGATALHISAKAGHHKVIETLLNCNVSPNIQDKNGKTALDHARKNNHKLCASILKEVTEDFLFNSQDKKVRFNDRVFTYDNSSIRSRTSMQSNSFGSRKNRDSMFDLDDDLLAQLDHWSSSPKIKRKREIKKKQGFIKGRSEFLSNEKFIKQSSRQETEISTPDILKDLNVERENFVFKTPTFVSTEYNMIFSPPKVPIRNGVPKLPQQLLSSSLTQSPQSTHKQSQKPILPHSYGSSKSPARTRSKSGLTSSRETSPKGYESRTNSLPSRLTNMQSNSTTWYKSPREQPDYQPSTNDVSNDFFGSPKSDIKTIKPLPNSTRSQTSIQFQVIPTFKRLSDIQSLREPPDGESQVGSPTTPTIDSKNFISVLPPAVPLRQNGINKKLVEQNKWLSTEKNSSTANTTKLKPYISSPIRMPATKDLKTVSPMLKPRYKSMVVNSIADDRPNYDATEYKPISYLNRSLSKRGHGKETELFTKNLSSLGMGRTANHEQVNFFSNHMNSTRMNITKEQTKWSTIKQGFSSIFNTVRRKKSENNTSSSWDYGKSLRFSPQEVIFSRFSIKPQKSNSKDFDDLFNTSVRGNYKSFNTTQTFITTPQGRINKKKVVDFNDKDFAKFKSRALDNSLKGKSPLVKSENDAIKSQSPLYDHTSAIYNHMKKSKERINDFIW